MKKRMVRLSVCALALAAVACQPRTQTKVVTVPVPAPPVKQGTEPVEFKKETYGTPLPLRLANPSCATRSDSQVLQSHAVQSVWFGFQDTEEETISITTRILNPMTFEREVTDRTDLRYTVQSPRQELRLCEETAPADTLEAIGLQIKKRVEDSFSFYKIVQDSTPQLKLPAMPAVGLGLFPQNKRDVKRIEQIIRTDGSQSQNATQTVTIETDNAFYSPFADDTLSPSIYNISVHPQSAEAQQQGLFDGKGLWESPVVIHHEYGHHVFQQLFGDSTVVSFQAYLDYWKSHRSLHAIHGSLGAQDLSGDPEAVRQRHAFLGSPGRIFGALNEGFADLFAFYSLNEGKDLFNISCFEETRDVPNPHLYGGLPKVWNEDLWRETFDITMRMGLDTVDKSKASPLELCRVPSFDDIHVVGAVLAHTVDSIFQTTVPARREGLTPTLHKASLMMQWIQALRTSDEVLELSSKQTLSRILNTALGTALTALGDHDKMEYCRVVQQKFPAILTRWEQKPAEDAAGILEACPKVS
jgi:hypothetical protein